MGALALGLSQWSCSTEKKAPSPGLWQQAVSTLPTTQNSTKNTPRAHQETLQARQSLEQDSISVSPENSTLSRGKRDQEERAQPNRGDVVATSNYTQQAYPALVERDREVYSGGRYYGASVRVAPGSRAYPSGPAPSGNTPSETVEATPANSLGTPSSGRTISSGGGTVIARPSANNPTASTTIAGSTTPPSSSGSPSEPSTVARVNTPTPTAAPAINIEADRIAPALSPNEIISNKIESNNPTVPLSGERVPGDQIAFRENSENPSSLDTLPGTPSQGPDYEVATRSTTLAITAENAPSGSGDRVAAASGDGILGSSVEPVVLPSIGVTYVTLFGQADTFQESSIKNLDYSVWFLDEEKEQYEKTATARTYLKKIFLPDEEIPQHPDCQYEELDSGRIEAVCDGKLPTAKGFMIRLISCGVPSMGLMYDIAGDAENPVAEYIDRAFIMGNPDLAAKELCPERRYVDYEFGAMNEQDPAEMQIRFPLEVGKMYFLTQFPTDYLQKVDEYGPPAPNYMGKHDSTYPDAASLTNFLVNSRIIQVIIAAPRSGGNFYGISPDQKQLNITYPRADYAAESVQPPTLSVPSSTYCQDVAQWNSRSSDMELELFKLVNQTRSEARSCGAEGRFEPAVPLKFDPALQCAARHHSQDMTVQDFFSHYNPQGLSEFERIFYASLAPPASGIFEEMPNIFPITGENIAQGIQDPRAAIEKWLESDEHCANLMSPMFTHMGMGFHSETGSPAHLTLNFGTVLK